jgi:eukaryotic-like serine/threonine-protein kinase
MRICPDCKRTYEDNSGFCVFDGQRLMVTEEVDPFVGTLIDGKYHVDRRIAKGGSGNVYQATHIKLNALVAVKILHLRLSSDPLAIERVRREAFVTMKVRHTNAIAVMDFGITDEKVVYVVTELLKGVTLDQRLRKNGSFSPSETNHIVQQVCAAMAVAHDHQIIHRDLKPENIFIHTDEDRELVKVVDFGIAMYKSKVDDEEQTMRLTQAGFVVGTPYYMSPEQCSGLEIDYRSDIYSLGILIYQLLTGKLPFEGTKAGIIVMKHKNEKPRPLYEIKPDIPAVLNAVVMRALEKKPENRQQTMTELAHEFESAVKAITEQELQHVFLNATEDDLEAAILLASEPEKIERMRNSSNRLTGSFDSETAKTAKSSSSKTPTFSTDRENTTDKDRPQIDSLFIELLESSKELMLLLQIVINDLENNSAPDAVLFSELKANADQLRGLLFGIKKTHYKTLV